MLGGGISLYEGFKCVTITLLYTPETKKKRKTAKAWEDWAIVIVWESPIPDLK